MADTKFTPGLWHYIADAGEVLSDVINDRGIDIVCTFDESDAPEHEIHANGRLIAAAPELYRAAAFFAQLSDDGFDDEGQAELALARAALAKVLR
jgi:hypothetical protein